MIVGSVCSGICADKVAWTGLDMSFAWVAEIEPFCKQLIAQRHPGVFNHGDFTKIEASSGPIDLLVGGTPCQSFSVAGGRAGLDDARGNLAIEFLRLARRVGARWFLWENVPGLFSSWSGREDYRSFDGDRPGDQIEEFTESSDFGAFLDAVEECGFACAWRILDARYWGVAQRRRRVFVVGHIGSWTGPAAVLFNRESLFGNPEPRRATRPEAAGSLGGGPGRRGRCDDLDRAGAFIARPLKSGGNDRQDESHETYIPDISPAVAAGSGGSKFGSGRDGQDVFIGVIHSDAIGRDGVNQKAGPDAEGRVRIRDAGLGISSDDQSFTVSATGTHAVAFKASHFTRGKDGAPSDIVPPLSADADKGDQDLLIAATNGTHAHIGVRRLLPVEAERLMGFPDDYTLIDINGKPVADSPRYRALGNSIVVPVMRWLGTRILAVDEILSRIGT